MGNLQEWCESLSFQCYTFVFTESKNDYENILLHKQMFDIIAELKKLPDLP